MWTAGNAKLSPMPRATALLRAKEPLDLYTRLHDWERRKTQTGQEWHSSM